MYTYLVDLHFSCISK